jgi:hypothetical protein
MFDVLGLTPTYDLDLAYLEEQYFMRQKIAHPDCVIGNTQQGLSDAGVTAALVNQAYKTSHGRLP